MTPSECVEVLRNPTHETPMMIRIDDIFAALLLSLVMFRRLEVLSTRFEDNTHIPEAAFDHWKRAALRALHISAGACFGKVFLSLVWFYAAPSSGWMRIGGFTIFAVWVALLVWSWSLSTDARALKLKFGIKPRVHAPANSD